MVSCHTRIDLAKVYKKSGKQIKKPPKYIITIHVDNKGLEFIHLNSILHEDDIINCFPESLREDEIPPTVYPVPSETFNYVNTIKMINTNETRTYGTGIISCNCTNSKYLNHYHGKIITLWDN